MLDYKAANDKALLAALIFNNPNLGPKPILQMFGLTKALESVTLRELRAMFANYNPRNWYRLIADVNKVKLPDVQSPFGIIREHIIRLKPYLIGRSTL